MLWIKDCLYSNKKMYLRVNKKIFPIMIKNKPRMSIDKEYILLYKFIESDFWDVRVYIKRFQWIQKNWYWYFDWKDIYINIKYKEHIIPIIIHELTHVIQESHNTIQNKRYRKYKKYRWLRIEQEATKNVLRRYRSIWIKKNILNSRKKTLQS